MPAMRPVNSTYGCLAVGGVLGGDEGLSGEMCAGEGGCGLLGWVVVVCFRSTGSVAALTLGGCAV